MKESITKFDLEAAFKALDEIDVPAAKTGIKANKPALTEIFSRKSKFDTLFEEYYDIGNTEELNAAKEAREAEVAKAKLARIEKIVDLDAESPEDLLTSYVGKFIIQCPQCMTLFYKNPEDVVESEEDPNTVNVEEVCQHCGNDDGYTLIGKVGEATPEEAAEEFGATTEEEIPAEDAVEGTEEPVDTEDAEDLGSEDDFDLDSELEELDLEIEDDEETDKKEEALSTDLESNYLLEQLSEDVELDISDAEFEELINSPEFKKPISDRATRAMLNTEAGLDEDIKVNEYTLTFEPVGDVKDEDLTNRLCDLVSKVGVKYHSAKKLAGKYYISIIGSDEDLHTAKLAIENGGFFKSWVEQLASSYSEENEVKALNEASLTRPADIEEKVLDYLENHYSSIEELRMVDPDILADEIYQGLIGPHYDEEGNEISYYSAVANIIDEYIENKLLKESIELEEGILDKLKDKFTDIVDKVTDKLKSREAKADWILANAMEDYGKVEVDTRGQLVPDEENQRFHTFIIIGYEDKYTNGKLITMAPSFNNEDLKIGKNGIQVKQDYESADNIAKGWSMRQGNGPAFIYLAKDKDDDKAVFLCEYFKGELKHDQLKKYFEVVKNDLKAAKLMAKGGMAQGEEEPVEKEGTKPKSTTATPTPISKKTTSSQSEEIVAKQLEPGMEIIDDSYTCKIDGAKRIFQGTITEVKRYSAQKLVAVTLKFKDNKTATFALKSDAKIRVYSDTSEAELDIAEREAAATEESLNSIMNGLEELHEASLEALISKSLVETYKNIAGFRLSDCNYFNEAFKVNGTIYFTSGKTRKTTYAFTEAYNKENKIILRGLNEKLDLDKQFTITGSIDKANKTFITESFKSS